MVHRLRDVAHARSGDKTGSANVAVIATDPADYPRIGRALRPDAITACLGLAGDQPVHVFGLPKLGAYNVWLPGALGGAVTATLSFDVFGHYLGMRILSLELDQPDDVPGTAEDCYV